MRETGTNQQAPDGPTDNGRATEPEAAEPAEAGEPGAEQSNQRPQDRPGSEQLGEAASGVPEGAATGDARSAPGQDKRAQPSTETREAPAGGAAADEGTDGRRDTDGTPPPSEGTDRSTEAPEPPGEHDGDHGRKGQDDGSEQNSDETNQTNPEVPANPILSNVYTDGRGQVHVEPRYGRDHTDEPGTELARNQPETTEPAQLPDREDLDPVGAEGGEGGRGELRDPEDDPESRDYQEDDPDNPSRGRDSLRRFLNVAENAKDATNTYSETAQHNLERVQPTGQLCGERTNNDHISVPNQAAKYGDAAVGAVGTAIVAVEIVRGAVQLTRRITRRENADH